MATDALKSTVITNLDASPPTKPAAGAGGANGLQEVSASVTATAGVLTGSTYKMVRLRSNVYVKHVFFESAAAGSNAAFTIGLSYSDGVDGTATANQGVVINASLFASAFDPTLAIPITEKTNTSGSYTADKRIQPLWQAAGLSSDPGGFFDVVVTSGGTNTNGGLMGLSVQFTTV